MGRVTGQIIHHHEEAMDKEPLIFDVLRKCGVDNLKGIVQVDIHVTPTEFDLYIERHYAPDGRNYFITNFNTLIKQVEYINVQDKENHH
jgi:hypothetical protein